MSNLDNIGQNVWIVSKSVTTKACQPSIKCTQNY
jgi:hypothetical protein